MPAITGVHSPKGDLVIGDGILEIYGSFIYNGSAIVQVRGKGFTVARQSAGKFLITLDGTAHSLISGDASQNANGTPSSFTPAAVLSDDFVDVVNQNTDQQAGSQLQLWTLNSSGNPADPATTTRVVFTLCLSMSLLNR